jgi:hypothetical protein
MRFEPNRGQLDDEVRFLARGPGFALRLTDDGATLSLRKPGSAEGRDERRAARDGRFGRERQAEAETEAADLSMRVVGARPVPPQGREVQPGTTNYFLGNDPRRWRTGVEAYARARYSQVLPGVDLVYYGNGEERLEYDLVLAAGVDPSGVALSFEGVDSLHIDADGAAVLMLPGGGEVVQPRPVAYQTDGQGDRVEVDARYEMREGALAFAVGPHDPRRELVIDPTITYSTYLGGSLADYGNAVAVDGSANIYVAGSTTSTSLAGFPHTPGGEDAFVAKLDANGAALSYVTYLGGSYGDGAEVGDV